MMWENWLKQYNVSERNPKTNPPYLKKKLALILGFLNASEINKNNMVFFTNLKGDFHAVFTFLNLDQCRIAGSGHWLGLITKKLKTYIKEF